MTPAERSLLPVDRSKCDNYLCTPRILREVAQLLADAPLIVTISETLPPLNTPLGGLHPLGFPSKCEAPRGGFTPRLSSAN